MVTTYPTAIPREVGPSPMGLMALAGSSQAARGLKDIAAVMGRAALPVTIIGEPGSGADALAYAIHAFSADSEQPFSIVECNTVDASLFAHDQASWPTSPLASRGSVVLNRPCELSASSQAALAQLLTDPNSPCKSRLLVCTERELEEDVRCGRLREDLVRLLARVFVRMPSLRQRREDILEMAELLIEKYSILFDRPRPILGRQLKKVLEELPWPGNITELDAAARMIVLVGDERVCIGALKSAGRGDKAGASRVSLKDAARAASRAAEREVIQKVLSRNGGNRKLAARQLQISYKALLYKLKQFGFSPRTSRGTI